MNKTEESTPVVAQVELDALAENMSNMGFGDTASCKRKISTVITAYSRALRKEFRPIIKTPKMKAIEVCMLQSMLAQSTPGTERGAEVVHRIDTYLAKHRDEVIDRILHDMYMSGM